ncbi:DNA-directed RNA polymerase subunit beta [Bacillus gobiensis]|uniref:DNA-directed RNA polymerase subunit beta n=1 Tax=Bacillus gobiensis TaxID=1441095 RepID=UPI003D1C5F97
MSPNSEVQVNTRYKRRKAAKTKEKKPTIWNVRVRLIPIWLRLILVAFFMVLALIGGWIIGYSVIGDGNAGDALKWDTFQHMYDLVNKKVD